MKKHIALALSVAVATLALPVQAQNVQSPTANQPTVTCAPFGDVSK